LQDGQLNVALQDDTAVDWAVLNLQVVYFGRAPGDPGGDTLPPLDGLALRALGGGRSSGADGNLFAPRPENDGPARYGPEPQPRLTAAPEQASTRGERSGLVTTGKKGSDRTFALVPEENSFILDVARTGQ